MAEAKAKRQRIEGEADAEADAIRNEAHSKDRDFYVFLQKLAAYKLMLAESRDVLLLSSKNELFDMLLNPPKPHSKVRLTRKTIKIKMKIRITKRIKNKIKIKRRMVVMSNQALGSITRSWRYIVKRLRSLRGYLTCLKIHCGLATSSISSTGRLIRSS